MDNGYNQNGYNQNGYNQVNPQQTPGFTKYLILSILELLCCCQITGVIGLIFTILANSSFKSGNMIDYQQKMKVTKIVLIAGLVIGLVVALVGFMIGFGSFMTALFEY